MDTWDALAAQGPAKLFLGDIRQLQATILNLFAKTLACPEDFSAASVAQADVQGELGEVLCLLLEIFHRQTNLWREFIQIYREAN